MGSKLKFKSVEMENLYLQIIGIIIWINLLTEYKKCKWEENHLI